MVKKCHEQNAAAVLKNWRQIFSKLAVPVTKIISGWLIALMPSLPPRLAMIGKWMKIIAILPGAYSPDSSIAWPWSEQGFAWLCRLPVVVPVVAKNPTPGWQVPNSGAAFRQLGDQGYRGSKSGAWPTRSSDFLLLLVNPEICLKQS